MGGASKKHLQLQNAKTDMDEKEIRCKHCKDHKLLAKIRKDGKIMVWCKSCHKEVELEVEPHEPENKLDGSVEYKACGL